MAGFQSADVQVQAADMTVGWGWEAFGRRYLGNGALVRWSTAMLPTTMYGLSVRVSEGV